MLAAPLILFLTLPPQLPGDSIAARDSVAVISEIRDMIDQGLYQHYSENLVRSRAGVRRLGPPPAERWSWWVPAPIPRGPPSCRGESLEECLGGDWSCRIIDCMHPQQRIRRARVIEAIEEIAPLAGGSQLVYRQRVALALKQGEPERAVGIARSCFGTEWWCLALRGFVAHWERPGAGLAMFDSAWAMAPAATRCAWLDVSDITDLDIAGGAAEPCAADHPLVARFWWLADPLWSRDGNQRLADHLARHVMTQMDRDLWSSPLETCPFLREGFPNSVRTHIVARPVTAWETMSQRQGCLNQPTRSRVETTADGRVFSMHPFRYLYGGYSFVPDSARLWNPLASVPSDWSVRWDRGYERLVTRERYHTLDDQQTAVFRRSSGYEVVAAALLPAVVARQPELSAALAVGRLEDLSVFSTPARITADTLRAAITVDSGSYLASIEAIGPEAVGRARHGASLPPLVDGFGLSDLALLDEQFEADEMALVAALLPAPTLSRRSRGGLYFEVYGVAADEPLEVELSAESTGASPVRRMLAWLRLTSALRPLRVAWSEAAGATEERVASRFLVLDPGTLPLGATVLTVTVRRADGASATVSRKLTVRD